MVFGDNFTRVLAPLALLLAWEAVARKQLTKAVPLIVMAAPPLLVPAAKAGQIARGLVSSVHHPLVHLVFVILLH